MSKSVFISFDYDYDSFLRDAVVSQAKNPDSPFSIVDRSVKEPLTGDCKTKVRGRISRADLVIVICGEHTHTATGVDVELQFAKDLNKPYFLLWGYKDKQCTAPKCASSTDKIYSWTWDILKKLINGER